MRLLNKQTSIAETLNQVQDDNSKKGNMKNMMMKKMMLVTLLGVLLGQAIPVFALNICDEIKRPKFQQNNDRYIAVTPYYKITARTDGKNGSVGIIERAYKDGEFNASDRLRCQMMFNECEITNLSLLYKDPSRPWLFKDTRKSYKKLVKECLSVFFVKDQEEQKLRKNILSTEERFTDKRCSMPRPDVKGMVKIRTFQVKTLNDFKKGEPTLLHTIGLGPCVGVALASPENGVGGLAHIDPGQSVTPFMKEFIKEMREAGSKEILAFIIGGQQAYSERALHYIYESLKEAEIDVIHEDTLGIDSARNIALDIEAGIVCDTVKKDKKKKK
ncbi:hypothetical protein ACFL6Y_00750 [Elusimicrobiota bacterium]